MMNAGRRDALVQQQQATIVSLEADCQRLTHDLERLRAEHHSVIGALRQQFISAHDGHQRELSRSASFVKEFKRGYELEKEKAERLEAELARSEKMLDTLGRQMDAIRSTSESESSRVATLENALHESRQQLEAAKNAAAQEQQRLEARLIEVRVQLQGRADEVETLRHVAGNAERELREERQSRAESERELRRIEMLVRDMEAAVEAARTAATRESDAARQEMAALHAAFDEETERERERVAVLLSSLSETEAALQMERSRRAQLHDELSEVRSARVRAESEAAAVQAMCDREIAGRVKVNEMLEMAAARLEAETQMRAAAQEEVARVKEQLRDTQRQVRGVCVGRVCVGSV